MTAIPDQLVVRLSSPDPGVRNDAYGELLGLTLIFIRAAMGRRLRDHRESADVCQSIAASFAQDLGAGQVKFENQAALAAYLNRVVHTKLAMLARHDRAAKRGGGDALAGRADGSLDDLAAGPNEATPSFAARSDEAYLRLVGSLNEEEQNLLRLRAAGFSWERIAEQTGRDAAALRQQFSRLQRKVTEELGSMNAP